MPAKSPAPSVLHPCCDDLGRPVRILKPSTPSAPALWSDPSASLCFTPGGAVPPTINGVALAPWAEAPTRAEGWATVEGFADLPDDPPVAQVPGKGVSAGCVVLEPDGRVWLVCPTNGFAGRPATFPKGRVEDGLSLQATAIKEVHEESGLRVAIVGCLGDQVRTTTVARYYLAHRVGGTPAAMGWESQAVRLVPIAAAREMLTPLDRQLVSRFDGLTQIGDG